MWKALKYHFIFRKTSNSYELFVLKGINGVPKIKDGYNPATWMLEVTSVTQESLLGINFTNIYRNSDLYR